MNILIIALFANLQCSAIVPVQTGTGIFQQLEAAKQWNDIQKYTEQAVSVTYNKTPLFDVRGVISGEEKTITINKKEIKAVCSKPAA